MDGSQQQLKQIKAQGKHCQAAYKIINNNQTYILGAKHFGSDAQRFCELLMYCGVMMVVLPALFSPFITAMGTSIFAFVLYCVGFVLFILSSVAAIFCSTYSFHDVLKNK